MGKFLSIEGTPVHKAAASGPNQRDARSYTKGSGVSMPRLLEVNVNVMDDVRLNRTTQEKGQHPGRQVSGRRVGKTPRQRRMGRLHQGKEVAVNPFPLGRVAGAAYSSHNSA